MSYLTHIRQIAKEYPKQDLEILIHSNLDKAGAAIIMHLIEESDKYFTAYNILLCAYAERYPVKVGEYDHIMDN